MRHTSKIDMTNLLRVYHLERNFAGVRAVFRAAGAVDVKDYGNIYCVEFPRIRWGKRIHWRDNPRNAVWCLEMLQAFIEQIAPEGT